MGYPAAPGAPQPASGYAPDSGVPVVAVPAAWAQALMQTMPYGASAYPGQRPPRRQPKSAAALPSHMPVMSLADLFIPEFAPALLHWPVAADSKSPVREESASPAPPLGTRRAHFPFLRLSSEDPAPAPGASILATISIHACATAMRWTPPDQLALCAGPAGERLSEIPTIEWPAAAAEPCPAASVRVPSSARSVKTPMRSTRPRPKNSELPARLPRREIYAWNQPGFHPRLLQPRVRVSSLDAGIGEMVAPATI
jgi:hypothetical protein